MEILNEIVAKVPPPADTSKRPLRALIFDRYSLNFVNFIKPTDLLMKRRQHVASIL